MAWIRILGCVVAMLLWSGCQSDETCRPGERECACDPSGGCGEGLVCAGGSCVAPRETRLRIPPAARACEVLLRDAGGQVADVRFDGGVTGTHVREAPRTALSFASTTAASVGGVSVVVLGEGEAFAIERSRCFDGAGRPLADDVRRDG